MSLNRTVDVAVVGAGPYGLSIVAHLRGRGLDARIFGSPMETWRERMPKGMFLKSEGFASSLYDPDRVLYARALLSRAATSRTRTSAFPSRWTRSRPTASRFNGASRRTWIQRMVAGIVPSGDGFELRLSDGETIAAQRVVLAIGLTSLPPHAVAVLGAAARVRDPQLRTPRSELVRRARRDRHRRRRFGRRHGDPPA